MKAFSEDKINLTVKQKLPLGWAGNIVAIGENVTYHIFSFFHNVSKGFFPMVVKTRDLSGIELNLSQTTNFTFSNRKFAGDNFEFEENAEKFSKRVENTVAKGGICLSHAIYSFPTLFPKDMYCRHKKANSCL